MNGGIDTRAFRQALGLFATGITVVTAAGPEDEPVGLTVNSFSSVSLAPPLILFSVDRQARSLGMLEAAAGYGISVLSAEQRALSDRFARLGGDKWAGVSAHPGHADAPLIRDAMATFECKPYATYDGGDHVIFVARVLRFQGNDERAPLVFFRGRYMGVDTGDQREAAWPLAMHY